MTRLAHRDLAEQHQEGGGSLALSTTANAQDIVTMRWDGSGNWVEVSRALNVNQNTAQ